jgi:hypothetical protein
MESSFTDDVSHSTRVVADTWRHRSIARRLEEWLANLASYWW